METITQPNPYDLFNKVGDLKSIFHGVVTAEIDSNPAAIRNTTGIVLGFITTGNGPINYQFNRALCYLRNSKTDTFDGVYGVGPYSKQEADNYKPLERGGLKQDLDYAKKHVLDKTPINTAVREIKIRVKEYQSKMGEQYGKKHFVDATGCLIDLYKKQGMHTNCVVGVVPLYIDNYMAGFITIENFIREPIVHAHTVNIKDVADYLTVHLTAAKSYKKYNKSNINSATAHEIRNPATSIGGHARRIIKEVDKSLPVLISMLREEAEASRNKAIKYVTEEIYKLIGSEEDTPENFEKSILGRTSIIIKENARLEAIVKEAISGRCSSKDEEPSLVDIFYSDLNLVPKPMNTRIGNS